MVEKWRRRVAQVIAYSQLGYWVFIELVLLLCTQVCFERSFELYPKSIRAYIYGKQSLLHYVERSRRLRAYFFVQLSGEL